MKLITQHQECELNCSSFLQEKTTDVQNTAIYIFNIYYELWFEVRLLAFPETEY